MNTVTVRSSHRSIQRIALSPIQMMLSFCFTSAFVSPTVIPSFPYLCRSLFLSLVSLPLCFSLCCESCLLSEEGFFFFFSFSFFVRRFLPTNTPTQTLLLLLLLCSFWVFFPSLQPPFTSPFPPRSLYLFSAQLWSFKRFGDQKKKKKSLSICIRSLHLVSFLILRSPSLYCHNSIFPLPIRFFI